MSSDHTGYVYEQRSLRRRFFLYSRHTLGMSCQMDKRRDLHKSLRSATLVDHSDVGMLLGGGLSVLFLFLLAVVGLLFYSLFPLLGGEQQTYHQCSRKVALAETSPC